MSAYETLVHSGSRERWLDLRRQGIGSSDAPRILLGDFRGRSSLDVYLSKVLPSTESPPNANQAKWFAIGHAAEPLVLELYGKETGSAVTSHGHLLRNLERPWQMCTPDGVANKDGEPARLVEAKFGTLDWSDGCPFGVWIQLQHQLDCMGWEFGAVANLTTFPSSDLVWAHVERDEDFCAAVLRPACLEFWAEHVEKEIPPEPGASRAATSALSRMFAAPTEKEIDLPPHLCEADSMHDRLLEAKATAVHELDNLKNNIRAAMGDATLGRFPNGVAWSWRPNVKGVRTLLRHPAKA